MVKPEAPDWFSWTISIVFHLEILVVAALLIGDEVEVREDDDPPVYSAIPYSSMTSVRPYLSSQKPPDWTGRWPMNCDHAALIRMAEKWPQEVVADTLCQECGWAWWVIRAALQD